MRLRQVNALQRAFCALVLLLTAFAAAAQSVPPLGAKVLRAGLYEATVTRTFDVPGAVLGRAYGVDYEFFSDSTNVPARRGVRFGFEYRLEGPAKGASVPIRQVVVFPPAGLRDPQTGEVFSNSELTMERRVGDLCLIGYVLGSDWMIVPGIWNAQVWSGNQKLAERRFTVAHP